MKLRGHKQKDTRRQKKTRIFTRRISRNLLTFIAIAVTIWPLIAAGLWVRSIAYDNRKVENLASVHRTYPGFNPSTQGMVTITFEDGWESAYKNAAPVLSKENIPATFYVITDTFEDENYFSEKQILSLQKTGHEIGSHTVTHPDLTHVSQNQIVYELDHSKSTLEKLLGKPVLDFSSPLNAYNDTVVNVAKSKYRSHRTTDAALVNSPYNINKDDFDIYHIKAYTVRRTTNINDLRAYLAYTKAQKGWAVLVYHQVETNPQEIPAKDQYAVTKKDFEDQMKVVTESGLPIIPLGDALNALNKHPLVGVQQ